MCFVCSTVLLVCWFGLAQVFLKCTLPFNFIFFLIVICHPRFGVLVIKTVSVLNVVKIM